MSFKLLGHGYPLYTTGNSFAMKYYYIYHIVHVLFCLLTLCEQDNIISHMHKFVESLVSYFGFSVVIYRYA